MTLSAHIDAILNCLKKVIPARVRESTRRSVITLLTSIGRPSFKIGNLTLPYLFHDYNKAWTSERALEVPFVKHYLDQTQSPHVLEVGNVLSHYFPIRHTVIDKYEVAPGVINCDVVDLDPNEQYDLIVSISTLEHVGFDETPRDDQKVLAALDRLQASLSTRGTLIVTVPIGQNPNLDRLIQEGRFAFEVEYYLQKVSALNKWRQVGREQALRSRYGYPYVAANALLIGLSHRE